jgi:hypothetical protein
MVIVVEGHPVEESHPLTDEEIADLLTEKLKTMRDKEAIATVSEENAVPKNRVYAIRLAMKKEGRP